MQTKVASPARRVEYRVGAAALGPNLVPLELHECIPVCAPPVRYKRWVPGPRYVPDLCSSHVCMPRSDHIAWHGTTVVEDQWLKIRVLGVWVRFSRGNATGNGSRAGRGEVTGLERLALRRSSAGGSDRRGVRRKDQSQRHRHAADNADGEWYDRPDCRGMPGRGGRLMPG